MPQMITRTSSLITSMIRAKQFSAPMLRRIWDAAEGQHEQVVAAIYNTLADGVCEMHGASPDVIKELLRCMRSKFVVDKYKPAPEAVSLLERVCVKASEFNWPADLCHVSAGVVALCWHCWAGGVLVHWCRASTRVLPTCTHPGRRRVRRSSPPAPPCSGVLLPHSCWCSC